MIRKFVKDDIDRIMHIWLNTNLSAHCFVSEKYWKDNYEQVKTMLPESELYVYENNGEISGFIGLTDSYIAGIFVRDGEQSKGIGKQLLDYVKRLKEQLSLNVYRENCRAVKFYQREGFGVSSESIDESTGHAEYLMLWRRRDSISPQDNIH